MIESNVIVEAREMLSRPKTIYGWGDVGEVLTDFISGSIDEEEAIDRLRWLEVDYKRERTR